MLLGDQIGDRAHFLVAIHRLGDPDEFAEPLDTRQPFAQVGNRFSAQGFRICGHGDVLVHLHISSRARYIGGTKQRTASIKTYLSPSALHTFDFHQGDGAPIGRKELKATEKPCLIPSRCGPFHEASLTFQSRPSPRRTRWMSTPLRASSNSCSATTPPRCVLISILRNR